MSCRYFLSIFIVFLALLYLFNYVSKGGVILLRDKYLVFVVDTYFVTLIPDAVSMSNDLYIDTVKRKVVFLDYG